MFGLFDSWSQIQMKRSWTFRFRVIRLLLHIVEACVEILAVQRQKMPLCNMRLLFYSINCLKYTMGAELRRVRFVLNTEDFSPSSHPNASLLSLTADICPAHVKLETWLTYTWAEIYWRNEVTLIPSPDYRNQVSVYMAVKKRAAGQRKTTVPVIDEHVNSMNDNKRNSCQHNTEMIPQLKHISIMKEDSLQDLVLTRCS